MGGYRASRETVADHQKYGRTTNNLRGPEIRHIYNDRLNQFSDNGEYGDVNLQACMYHGRVDSGDYISLEVYSVPDLQRPLFKDAIKNKFRAASKGETFGPSWSTHWFRVTVHKIPKEWQNYERIQLEFDLPEALVYSEDGTPLQGLTGGYGGDRRVDFILKGDMRQKKTVLYIETSMNGMFGVGGAGQIQPPDMNRYFRLDSADLVAPNMEAWRLFWDFWIIKDISRELPQNGYESHEALRIANEIMNTFDHTKPETIKACRQIAQTILGPTVDTADVYSDKTVPVVSAVGNCHIDTAWLWPFGETRRKIARSWSTQIDLMDRYSEHIFTCSQAQQFKWLEQDYPKLFDKVTDWVKKGAFEPIGGTWVEMDTNIPSGESLIRQFQFGQRFFKEKFGKTCKVFWLPDTFGYSAQLPQLSRLAGMNHFFTQKLSWNNINDFPHSTFNWQALDGSQVLTHMAPDNTYTAQADLGDVLRSEKQNKSLSDTRNSLLAFGNGDGGGGPLAAMFEKLRRCRGASDTNAPSLPRVQMSSVTSFYDKLEKDSDFGRKLRTWSGELYFELHRGTYTSQAKTKYYNRTSEKLLHEIEHYGAMAKLLNKTYHFPYDEINALWEDVLLCQFHDVLPGSCIGMVYDDEHRIHENVLKNGQKLLDEALDALGVTSILKKEDSEPCILNSLPWSRREVIKQDDAIQVCSTTGQNIEGDAKIRDHGEGNYTLSNKNVVIQIKDGCITSFYDRIAGREIVAEGQRANEFQIYEDRPLNWQAWDVEIYHLDKPPIILTAPKTSITSHHPHQVSLMVEYSISHESWLKCEISLDSSTSDSLKQLNFNCTCNWHENKKFLKVAFPTTIHSDFASYETQFGVIRRPTHRNTSWDAAKFEVCCHKYADLSDYNYGLSILNDSKYGFATLGSTMRLSLLRAPKAPDATADMGTHVFKYAMLAHSGALSHQTVRRGYEFNYPLRIARIKSGLSIPRITLDGPENIILESIIPHDKGIVIRVFEALGGAGRFKLIIPDSLALSTAIKVDLLDTELEVLGETISIRAFEVMSIMVYSK